MVSLKSISSVCFTVVFTLFIGTFSVQAHTSSLESTSSKPSSSNFENKNSMHPKKVIYLLPGHGSDYRVFGRIDFPEEYEIKHLEFVVPEKGTSMKEYAHIMAEQIDTTREFVLIGVSLGGMIATEMNDFLSPEKTIIIASAKSRKELPLQYRFQKTVPIQKIVPPKMIKRSALFLQPIVEPDAKNDLETFQSMLGDKDPLLMHRGVAMIVNWKRKTYNEEIIHIHGEKDHTLPIRNIKYTYFIPKGSHMMTFTRSEEIGEIIRNVLDEC